MMRLTKLLSAVSKVNTVSIGEVRLGGGQPLLDYEYRAPSKIDGQEKIEAYKEDGEWFIKLESEDPEPGENLQEIDEYDTQKQLLENFSSLTITEIQMLKKILYLIILLVLISLAVAGVSIW